MAVSAHATAWGYQGVEEHAADYLRSGVCARLIAQLAKLPYACPGGPFKDHMLTLSEAAA